MSEVLRWLESCRHRSRLSVQAIRWSDCAEWRITEERITHSSGGFFSILALRSPAQPGLAPAHAQPMIDQPEIGILGFLLRRTGDRIEWLLQAKTEPGNTGGTQIAPSVQATESNYNRRHGGSATPYLDIFLAPGPHRVLSNVLGSEQGSRFIGKYNRNMSILLDNDPGVGPGDNLRWYPSSTLRGLLLEDFHLNTDSRSSLFCSDWGMLADNTEPFTGRDDEFTRLLRDSYLATAETSALLDWLQRLRTAPRPIPTSIPLEHLPDWRMMPEALCRADGPAVFEVRAYAVSTRDREVEQWCQPLLRGLGENLAVLYCQVRNGTLHFLLRASWEIGFKEGFQLGPSWQSDAMSLQSRSLQPLLHDSRIRTLCQIRQSDEGGRFIDSICRYRLSLLPADLQLGEEEHYCWVNLAQLHAMRSQQGLLTNEARSLLSMLLAWA